MAQYTSPTIGRWRHLVRWLLYIAMAVLCFASFVTPSLLGFVGKLFFVSALAILLLNTLQGSGKLTKKLFYNLATAIVSISVALLVCEVILRSPLCSNLGLKTYMESNGEPKYESPYAMSLTPCKPCGDRCFLVYPANYDYVPVSNEFHYRCRYNSLGLKDRELTTDKNTNEIRVLGLGDSFMEGSGAPEDSSLMRLLENKLNAAQSAVKYTTINGGIAGSDLFFSYDLLEKCLLNYHPDVVMLNLNSTDINDVMMRGGNERYDRNGAYVGRKGPWWEYLFGSSYIARLVAFKVFHINWQLMTDGQLKKEEAEAVNKISKKIGEYQKLADEKHFKFLLLLQPIMPELTGTDKPWVGLQVPDNVRTIYLADDFLKLDKASIEKLYWVTDRHFNSRGYDFEANSICNKYFWPER